MYDKFMHVFLKKKSLFGILFFLFLVLAVPITLNLLSKQQDIRQRAANVCSETGTDNILIIDTSNSMNRLSSSGSAQTRLQKAKEAAKQFADILAQKNVNLPEDKKHKLAVVTFSNSSSTKLNATLSADMSFVKSKIDVIEEKYNLSGWTCIECGVKKANAEFITTRARASQKNVAILLTDGKANWIDGWFTSVSQSVAEREAMEEVMKGYTNYGNSYYTIGLGAPTEINETFLTEIATKTGAKYYYSPTGEDLSSIYSAISQILGKGSISGFVYNDLNRNGTTSPDENEPRIASQSVELINTATKTVMATAVTDTEGAMNFSGLCDGTYQTKLKLPSGWTQTAPPDNKPHSITLTNGSSSSNSVFGMALIPSPTPTPVASPTATLTPTSVPSPTGTQSGAIKLNITLFMHGIGNSGDNANPTAHSMSNKNPLRKQRDVTVEMYDASSELVLSKPGVVTYASASGNFTGTIDMGTTLLSGNYTIKVKSPQYLRRLVRGIHNISAPQTLALPTITAVTGDTNNDNQLNILDYNIILGCYSDFAPAVSCTEQQKLSSDLTDDGKVNQFDYNLFLREMTVQVGD